MSDPSDELRICPHCGQQNSVFTLVCINCGQELDDIFEIEGVEDSSTENLHEQALEDVLKSLDKNPLLSPEEENAEDSETETKEPSDGEAPLPSWLDRIRQRAKEEDPAGDLAKASRAADEKPIGATKLIILVERFIGGSGNYYHPYKPYSYKGRSS